MLTHEELEGVIAHELSHIKHRDILISTIAAVVAHLAPSKGTGAEAAAVQGAAPVSAERPADIYAMSVGQGAHRAALAAVEALRDASPQLKVIQHAGGGSFKSQMKKADKSGARVALIWGEDEAASGSVTVRPLREGAGGERGEQRTVPVSELQAALDAVLAP